MQKIHSNLLRVEIKASFVIGLILTCFCFVGMSRAQTTTVWSEDWEGNWTRNWGVDAGTWEVGIPTSGPNKAYAGQKCAATVLAGNYSEWVDSRLIREPFLVPASSENPRLRYWQWFNFSSDDRGYVEIKVGTGSWIKISEEIWNTSSGRWSYASINLASYGGRTVQIAFHLISRADTYYSGTYTHVSSGWYIDDISLLTGPILFTNPENLEAGIGDWSVDKGTWQVGKPTSGPNAAHSGQNCAGTVIDGNYDDWVDSRFISPQFVVPAANENPRLRFWHWFNLSSDDRGYVEIRIVGLSWAVLSAEYWNTSSGRWTYASLDLSSYAGKTVQIAYHFISRSDSYYSGTYWHVSSGWYIDDVLIASGPLVLNSPEGWESGIGDWSAERGTWQVGKPTSGPSKAHGGLNCAATVLDGNYDDYVDSRLVSPRFVVPEAAKNPRLRFWHWYSFSSDDDAYVQIKTDTKDWETILGPYINTSSDTWTNPLSYDLTKYAGLRIQIGFRFISRANSYYSGTYWHVSTGWYIDDFEIDGYSINPPADQMSPLVSSTLGSPNPTAGATSVTLTALISDVGRGDSKITQAEYFFYKPGTTGTGYAMTAQDGSFNSTTEVVTATITNINTLWPVGSTQKLFVHGKDEYNNWSNFDSVTVQVTAAPVAKTISLPDTSITKGTIFTLPLYISAADGIAGAEIKLTYNANILLAKSVKKTVMTEGFALQDSISAGKCAITMAHATGLGAGGGILLNIDFEVLSSTNVGDTTTITFTTAKFYDESTNPLSVTTKNGKFTVKASIQPQVLTQLFVLPSSDTLAVNGTLVLTATGKDDKGIDMTVSPTWSVVPLFGSIGSVNPTQGASTTFTASGPGDGLIIAGQEGKSDSAIVVVGKTRGDINLDGANLVNVQDAILCLQIIVNKFTPHRYQLWAADYDGSGGKPDEADALRILNAALKTILPKNNVYASTAKVILGAMETRDDGLISIPVLVKCESELGAGGMEIDYDQNILSCVAVSASNVSTLLMSNLADAGLIQVSSIDKESLLDGHGVWMRLVFRSKQSVDDLPPVRITNIRLFDRAANPVATELASNQTAGIAVPERWCLYQNYPNPFNPSTSIRFDLSASAQVELFVYNATGQLVRSLIDGMLAAGTHGAIWDGRDSAGNPAPAGVYFYRMIIDHGAWNKIHKMILVK